MTQSGCCRQSCWNRCAQILAYPAAIVLQQLAPIVLAAVAQRAHCAGRPELMRPACVHSSGRLHAALAQTGTHAPMRQPGPLALAATAQQLHLQSTTGASVAVARCWQLSASYLTCARWRNASLLYVRIDAAHTISWLLTFCCCHRTAVACCAPGCPLCCHCPAVASAVPGHTLLTPAG